MKDRGDPLPERGNPRRAMAGSSRGLALSMGTQSEQEITTDGAFVGEQGTNRNVLVRDQVHLASGVVRSERFDCRQMPDHVADAGPGLYDDCIRLPVATVRDHGLESRGNLGKTFGHRICRKERRLDCKEESELGELRDSHGRGLDYWTR